MNKISLNKNEHKEVSSIVETYRVIESSFSAVQKQLEDLNTLKDNLLEQLESTKLREEEFFKLLESNYGKGKLDLYTLEYIKEE